MELVTLAIPATLAGFAVAPGPDPTLRRTNLATACAAVLSLVVAARSDLLTGTMLVLVSVIALVIARYSPRYLSGEAGVGRYGRALLVVLAAVTALVTATNLVVMAVAWLVVSLALHELLTFFERRPQALVAAHKKFLLSRAADAAVLGAILLLGAEVGSTDLAAVNAHAVAHGMSASSSVAAVLLVLGVASRSAQLPFHGWLIQVMEAPTPVSALLHAGVVNLGGFVLLRLAPFIDHAEVARTLLVGIGTLTAVTASLVMTTRISVKVALAWSTCAQMGFMLVECGLGAWSLALLHLVAHSLYKAYAFLRSGSTVAEWRAAALGPRRAAPPLGRVIGVALAGLVGLSVLGAVGARVAPRLAASLPELAPWALLLVLASAGSLARVRGLGDGGRLLGHLAGLAALYVVLHVLASRLVPAATVPPGPWRWAMALVGFAALFAVEAVLHARPEGAFARRLQPHLFAGFYLDEIFTRLTFRLWPPRLPSAHAERTSAPTPSTLEI